MIMECVSMCHSIVERHSYLLRIDIKLRLHDAIYRLRFYSNALIHISSLSNSHNNVAPIQKNRGDKSNRVIVTLPVGIESILTNQAESNYPTHTSREETI